MPNTSVKEIVNYWAQHEDESGLTVDWSEAHERCWRCGYKSKLERCHITPEALGGADEPGNLVLLCHRCHREAPSVQDPRFMWIWLRAHSSNFYDTFWTLRGMEEFEKMFGRKPFADFDDTQISKEEIELAMRSAMNSASSHFGEGRMNPSTIACVLHQVEQQLMERDHKGT